MPPHPAYAGSEISRGNFTTEQTKKKEKNKMKKIKLAGIGCGGRTRTYLSLAKERMSEYFDIVAAAETLS